MDTSKNYWEKSVTKLKGLSYNSSIKSFFVKIWLSLKIIYGDMSRCDLFKHASGMAYITLFSLIPSLAAIFSLVSLFSPLMVSGDANLIEQGKFFILSHLAAGSGDQVINQIDSFIGKLDISKIGLTGFAGIVVTLILLIRQIEIALNKIFDVSKPRNIVTRFVYFWTFLTLGTFLTSLSIGVIADFDFSKFLSVGESNDFAPSEKSIFASFVPFCGQWVFFALLYKIVPNCRVATRSCIIGAFVASCLLFFGSQFYGYYLKLFTNYRAIYGAVAAIPSFLLWLYILWLITLLGAVISRRHQEGFYAGYLPDYVVSMNDLRLTVNKGEVLQGRIILPFLLLLYIYRAFYKDGSSISLKSVNKKIKVPAEWLDDAYNILVDKGYINFENKKNSTDHTTYNLFPTKAADKIKVHDVLHDIVGNGVTYIQNSFSTLKKDPDLQYIKNIVANDEKEESKTLLQVLNL